MYLLRERENLDYVSFVFRKAFDWQWKNTHRQKYKQRRMLHSYDNNHFTYILLIILHFNIHIYYSNALLLNFAVYNSIRYSDNDINLVN